MKKTSKIAKQAQPRGVPKGAGGRLPVARSNAPARLAGRGGEKSVAVWSDFGEDLEDLPDLAKQLVSVNRRKADLEAEAGTIRRAIRDLMAGVKANESWTVRDEGTDWIATYIVSEPTKKLVPELLLAAGVKKDQLAKGYKTVPAKKPYVQVRTKGEETDSNEEHE